MEFGWLTIYEMASSKQRDLVGLASAFVLMPLESCTAQLLGVVCLRNCFTENAAGPFPFEMVRLQIKCCGDDEAADRRCQN
jgi:hypothetical protein